MKSHWPITVLSTISSIVNILLPLVLVRILTPDEIGQFKIFFLYVITIFPSFSLMSGVVSGLSYWAGQPGRALPAIRMTGTLMFLSGLLLLALALVFQAPIRQFFNWPAAFVPAFGLGLLGAMAGSFYDESSIATGKIWRGAIFSSGFDLLRTGSILVTAILTRSLAAVFYVHGAILTCKILIGYSFAYRDGLFRLEWAKPILREVWKQAFPISIAWAFGVLVGYSDQMVLFKYISASDFAFYSIGCLTVPPLLILEVSVTRVLIPQLSRAFALGESVQAAVLFRKAVGEIAYFAIPATFGLIVFASPIIEVLFTTKYAAASNYLVYYALFYLSLIVPNDSVPRARGETGWILKTSVVFSAMTLLLCWVLAIQHGPYGALAGLLISKFVTRAYTIYYMRTTTDWKLGDFLPVPEIARSFAVSGALSALCLLSRQYFETSLGWFLVAGFLFTLFYFALTLSWNRGKLRQIWPLPARS